MLLFLPWFEILPEHKEYATISESISESFLKLIVFHTVNIQKTVASIVIQTQAKFHLSAVKLTEYLASNLSFPKIKI